LNVCKRNYKGVTCVDCSKTFFDNDYEQHITCVSEAEKYEKSLHRPKKQKVNPQDSWSILIAQQAQAASAAPAALQAPLQKLVQFNNVPRNKAKFINFGKNSIKIYSESLLVALWDYLNASRPPVDETKAVFSNVTQDASSFTNNATTTVIECARPAEDVEGSDIETKKSKKRKKKEDKMIDVAVLDELVVEEIEESHKKKKKHKHERKNKDAEEDVQIITGIDA
jgi:cell growth-regulating nucleolar protein